MATEVLLPQFGMGMQEARILRWLKEVGDAVEEGEPLLEIEAEKAIFLHRSSSLIPSSMSASEMSAIP
jgi:pyruvate/2-oxoglutarate dehydrogenase complex dihydrolipoamide acyltransferase (E2) component